MGRRSHGSEERADTRLESLVTRIDGFESLSRHERDIFITLLRRFGAEGSRRITLEVIMPAQQSDVERYLPDVGGALFGSVEKDVVLARRYETIEKPYEAARHYTSAATTAITGNEAAAVWARELIGKAQENYRAWKGKETSKSPVGSFVDVEDLGSLIDKMTAKIG